MATLFNDDFIAEIEDMSEEAGLAISACDAGLMYGVDSYAVSIAEHDYSHEFMLKNNGELVCVKIGYKETGGIVWNGDDVYRKEYKPIITETESLGLVSTPEEIIKLINEY